MNDSWFIEAEKIAVRGLCARAKCGAVIVKNGVMIGVGYNAPPQDDLLHAKCDGVYDRNKKPKYDLTCCVHAEWRAIIDALRHHQSALKGATLYYVRLGDNGHLRPSGKPFCTVCSRLALDVGIAQFGLFNHDGPMLYDAGEYNNLSYAYHKESCHT